MKRNKSCLEMEDRLSGLPNAIILHILSSLETKLAVQTTILSKRWLHLWKDLPALNIYCKSFLDNSSLVPFISQFLLSHNTSFVHTLILRKLPPLDESSVSSAVSSIINHVVSRHIQHVDLGFRNGITYPEMNNSFHCLFASNTLMTLKLRNISITESSFNLPSLETLTLHFARFHSVDFLTNILSGCVRLKYLELKLCKDLDYEDEEMPCSGCFQNTAVSSSLKTLRILETGIIPRVNKEEENLPFDLFSGLVSLENLELSYCEMFNPGGFIISCPQLVNLKLEMPLLNEGKKLILSAPRLVSFELDMYRFFGHIELVLNDIKSLQMLDFRTSIRFDLPEVLSQKWKEDNFAIILDLFKSLSSVRSLYLTMGTMKALYTFIDVLENQICPLDHLEVLKVRVSETREAEGSLLPLEVYRYLSSGSPKLKQMDILLE